MYLFCYIELSRLLSTAQEKERKDLIIKAMQSLDEQNEMVKDGIIK